MERLSKMTSGVFSDPASSWAALQGQGEHILDLIKFHPWTSLGVATGTVLVWSYIRAPRNLPPGPRGLPWIGAVSCFTPDLPQRLCEWRGEYGEIISYYKCGRLHISLNSEKMIREAFVKRPEDFSYRADGCRDMIELGFVDDIGSGQYCEKWKKNKKFSASALKCFGFGTKISEGKIQDQLQHLESFLLKSNNSPVDIEEETKLFSAAILSTIIFGGSSARDETDAAELIRLVTAWYIALGGLMMTTAKYQDFLHPMVTRFLSRGCRHMVQLALNDYHGVLTEKVNNAALDISERDAESFVDASLKEHGCDAQNIHTIVERIATFFGDGIFTQAAVDAWCLIYITFHPEVQKQLHEEISDVCGPVQVPSLADRPRMPFSQAVVFESLRLSFQLQMSLDRELRQDVTLGGYTLPKGALVSANFYGVHFDTDIFPDPYAFKPSRFIDSEGKFDTSLAGKIMTFSVGSRQCLGEAYVKAHIFLLLTRLVQKFELQFDPSAPTPTLEKNAAFILNKPQNMKICFILR